MENRRETYTLNSVASRLGIERKWLKDQADAGELPHVKAGEKSYLFDLELIASILLDRARGPQGGLAVFPFALRYATVGDIQNEFKHLSKAWISRNEKEARYHRRRLKLMGVAIELTNPDPDFDPHSFNERKLKGGT